MPTGGRSCSLQVAVGAVHHHARGRAQQELVLGRHQIRPAQEDTARPVDPRLLGAALDDLLQRVLQILPVARAVLVQHDEIEGRPLPRRYSCALSSSLNSGSWLPSST